MEVLCKCCESDLDLPNSVFRKRRNETAERAFPCSGRGRGRRADSYPLLVRLYAAAETVVFDCLFFTYATTLSNWCEVDRRGRNPCCWEINVIVSKLSAKLRGLPDFSMGITEAVFQEFGKCPVVKMFKTILVSWKITVQFSSGFVGYGATKAMIPLLTSLEKSVCVFVRLATCVSMSSPVCAMIGLNEKWAGLRS
ncbi:hypothetical protein TNCV_2528991 [Trichonephila clavipes]|nr:hypothetical protein TNCV_2528991 [Trichonephila clavipes]